MVHNDGLIDSNALVDDDPSLLGLTIGIPDCVYYCIFLGADDETIYGYVVECLVRNNMGPNNDITDGNTLGDDNGSILRLPFGIPDGLCPGVVLGTDNGTIDGELLGYIEGIGMGINDGIIDVNGLGGDDGPLIGLPFGMLDSVYDVIVLGDNYGTVDRELVRYIVGNELGPNDGCVDGNKMGDDNGSSLELTFSIQDGVYDGIVLDSDNYTIDR